MSYDTDLVRWGGRKLRSEDWQVAATVGMLVADVITLLAGYSQGNGPIVAVTSAALGGFLHEIIQSGGSVAYPKGYSDGLYLGSTFGLVLGVIAGLLALGTLPTGFKVDQVFVSQMFFAGLALKGVAEAAGGQVKSPKGPSPSRQG